MIKRQSISPLLTDRETPSLKRLAARFTDTSRLRIMRHPFDYYAEGNTLVRMTSGDVCGLEGYRIRIARDRRLVVNVGGVAVAISDIHKETFVEVAGGYA